MKEKESQKVAITKKRVSNIYKILLHYLEEERVYLSPELTLIKLSVIVGTNTTYLSQAVNESCGMNLHTLINTYRVRYAEKLLLSGEYDIREVARKSGFGSRSAFYSAFQRVEGMPPSYFLVLNGVANARKRRKKSLT